MKDVIVDEFDNVVGAKMRDEIDAAHDIYRVSALWLTNSKGQILLARRAYTKKVNPGVWSAAVAGTVEEGEDYGSNIVKEIAEEIGLKVELGQLTKGQKMRITGARNYFLQWYLHSLDIDAETLRLADDEVAEAKWFSAEEIRTMMEETPGEMTPAATQWLPLLLQS